MSICRQRIDLRYLRHVSRHRYDRRVLVASKWHVCVSVIIVRTIQRVSPCKPQAAAAQTRPGCLLTTKKLPLLRHEMHCILEERLSKKCLAKMSLERRDNRSRAKAAALDLMSEEVILQWGLQTSSDTLLICTNADLKENIKDGRQQSLTGQP